MVDTRIVIAGLWVATMLTYLWGDVMRIFAGDVEPGKLTGGAGIFMKQGKKVQLCSSENGSAFHV